MHATRSGLADYVAEDERDALRLARRLSSGNFGTASAKPATAAEPKYDADDLLGIPSADLRVPFDPREILARILDGSEFDEFKPAYGPALCTGWGAIHGHRIGVLANARGVLFSAEAQKAAQFIQLANAAGTPLLFLQNTTGYMVGSRVRAGRHHQARRADDQRGGELAGAAPDGQHRRLLRRRQLRHVRPRLRARASCSPGRTPSRR